MAKQLPIEFLYIRSMRNLASVFFALLIIGCQKEPTTWNTRLDIPLVSTSLGLSDFIEDSLLQENSAGQAEILLMQNILDIGVDSIANFSPDSISKSFSIAPIIQFTFNPGQILYTSNDEFEFDGTDALMRFVKLKAGTLKVSASSTIDADMNLRLRITKALLNGESFDLNLIIPAGSVNTAGQYIDEIDLAEYELDLTGESGNDFNTIQVSFALSVASYEEPVTVFNTDEVFFQVKYENLDLSYAQGYLGSQTIDFSEKSGFIDLGNLNDALINLSAAQVNLSISNGFGLDMSAAITALTALRSSTSQSVSLSSDLIGGQINLLRAEEFTGQITASERNYLINETNSNILEFLNLLGDSISITGSAVLNPLGNVSNFNDFASDQSRLKCDAEVRIPMVLGLSGLALVDTVEFNWQQESNPLSQAVLYLKAENEFPSDAEISIHFLDGSNQEVLDLDTRLTFPESPIVQGSIGSNPALNVLTYQLSESDLLILQNAARSMAVYIRFETLNYPETVEFLAADRIQIWLSAEIENRIAVE